MRVDVIVAYDMLQLWEWSLKSSVLNSNLSNMAIILSVGFFSVCWISQFSIC